MIRKTIGIILVTPLSIAILLALILLFISLWNDVEHNGKEALITVGLIISALIGTYLLREP